MTGSPATLERRVQSGPAHSLSAHALSAEELCELLAVYPERGLSDRDAAERQAVYGENRLAEAARVPAWRRFLAQFGQLVIWILIVAALISAALGEWIDAGAILAIVLLNGLLGFLQEQRAERALEALKQLSAPMAKVLRDGTLRSVPARQVVPGDVIDLEAGDRIPADARLVRAFSFQTQEAALTGESLPVEKDADASLATEAPVADRRNMVYLGTVATSGKATAVVSATGMHTELGRIAGLLEQTEREPTPLQKRLAELGRVLVVVCLALVGLIFVLELFQNPILRELLLSGRFTELLRAEPMLDVFLLAVSLAVAAVPEGLPAVVTLALAFGLRRMVRRNALIRKLPSVETLGAVTVICSDKTGTLTRNEMTVREIVAGGTRYRVTGTGYLPEGDFLREASPDRPPDIDSPRQPALELVLTIGAACNNAQLREPQADGESWQVIGDPTEGALIVAARKAGIDTDALRRAKLDELPFDSERKMMSVILPHDDGRRVLYTKGAPESVLTRCTTRLHDGNVVPLDGDLERVLQASAEMASRALRVLALAYRVLPEAAAPHEDDLILAGLVGMIDPPREEVKAAMSTCRAAGIRPVMITGDHPATAQAIARELGMFQAGDRVVRGQDLDELSDESLADDVERIPVYARVSAAHKLRVVRAWKSRGQVVAMTGDGVNDAPAVKAADIGIAMGLTGTDVTKEASAMVLMDDNFASIVAAVEEGRSIYDNIRKVLSFLLSCNFGEILLMLVAALLGWPAPLLPIQLLWVNLVTDGLPALALSLERPEPGLMARPPRPANESMLSARLGLGIAFQGLLIGAVVLLAFGLLRAWYPDDLARAQTTAFCVLVYSELLRAFAARSSQRTAVELGLFTNPYLLAAIAASALLQFAIIVMPLTREVFQSTGHSLSEWAIIVLLALTPVTVIELSKLVSRWRSRAC